MTKQNSPRVAGRNLQNITSPNNLSQQQKHLLSNKLVKANQLRDKKSYLKSLNEAQNTYLSFPLGAGVPAIGANGA